MIFLPIILVEFLRLQFQLQNELRRATFSRQPGETKNKLGMEQQEKPPGRSLPLSVLQCGRAGVQAGRAASQQVVGVCVGTHNFLGQTHTNSCVCVCRPPSEGVRYVQ